MAGGAGIAARSAAVAPRGAPEQVALRRLVGRGALSAAEVQGALDASGQGTALPEILAATGGAGAAQHWPALAAAYGCPLIDPEAEPPDPRLIDALGAVRCAMLGLLPWRRLGGRTLVATCRPAQFRRHLPELEAALGPVTMAVIGEAAIGCCLLALRGAEFARMAETRVPGDESCRSLAGPIATALAALALAGAALLAVSPPALARVLALWALATLLLTAGLKLLALGAELRAAFRPEAEAPMPAIARLPIVSVMVPLRNEPDIAARLVARLGRVTWPRALFDVLLLLEAEDGATRRALDAAGLPGWIRLVTLPPGSVATKPRALNLALPFCRGSIVGVWDAEDAPAPDQIARVVERFHARGPQVACLQGVLDYYNPRASWITRCFALEYAGWFRVLLPGLVRLGLAIPLGGTTLFFRREALERVGAWDAHNVTEDADLGLRLARRGYRTEMIATATGEEATSRPLAWLKQRSRWQKGYMITWAAHMRAPRRLWRELGARRFAGMQVLFLGAISQVLLAPVLWALWLVPQVFGLPGWCRWPLVALCLGAEAVNLAVALLGARRAGLGALAPWALALPLYFPLGTAAALKALWELATRPFYWDKTRHGAIAVAPRAQRLRTDPASSFSRVSKAFDM